MSYTIANAGVTTVLISGGGGGGYSGGSSNTIIGTAHIPNISNTLTLTSTASGWATSGWTSAVGTISTGLGNSGISTVKQQPKIMIDTNGDIFRGNHHSVPDSGVFARLARIERALGLVTRHGDLEIESRELADQAVKLSKIENELLGNGKCGILETRYPQLAQANRAYNDIVDQIKMERYLTSDEDY